MPGIPSILSKISPFGMKPDKYTPASMPVVGPQNRVDRILNDFEDVLDYYKGKGYRDREEEAWKIYSGYENGQWDAEAVSKLQEEGRHVTQYNIIRQKIWGLAGTVVKNWFDLDFVPVEGEYSDLSIVLKKMMYSDKEMLDWDSPYMQLVIDGLVFRGVEEMVISDRYNPLGNIGFERVMPGHIMVDPGWLTNSGWDLKKAWKTAYLTVDEIKKKYRHMSEEIDRLIRLREALGEDYLNGNENGEAYPHPDLNDEYGTRYRVIEYHHMECETVKREISIADGTEIPDGDDDYKRQWCLLNRVDMSDGVIEIDRDINVYYVSTICPQLDRMTLLEDRKSEIQIGRLPFFFWSYGRINGVDGGVVELLKDAQQSINKRQSLLEYIIQTSATTPPIADPELFGNDRARMTEFEQNRNNPGYLAWSEPGALASGRAYFQQTPKSPLPQDIYQHINENFDVADRIIPLNPALEGRNESSHETGVLFKHKQIQGEINLTPMSKSLEYYWNEKGEAYLLLAKSLYSGVRREFRLNKIDRGKDGKIIGSEIVTINQRVDTPDGEVYLNDISTLPRHKVVVSLSPEGVSQRSADRMMFAELLKNTPPENVATRALLWKKLMQTIDMSTVDKEQLERAYDLEAQMAQLQIETNMKGLQAQQAQIDAQMGQMQQQQMQMLMGAFGGGGAGMGGQPQEQQAMDQMPQ